VLPAKPACEIPARLFVMRRRRTGKRQGAMSVTIKQIAEIVGVSRGTVDRAMHGRYGVNPDLKARIETVVRELDYKPNTVAKALKRAGVPMLFGVLIPSGTNRFFRDIDMGIREAAKAYEPNGVNLEIITESKFDAESQINDIDRLIEKKVNGIIMAGVDTVEVRKKINGVAKDIPFITYNTDVRKTDRLCYVGQNHVAAGRTAGDLMLRVIRGKIGKIVILISHIDIRSHRERKDGFEAILRSAGVPESKVEVLETYESDQLAYDLIATSLRNGKDITGVYSAGGGQVGVGKALAESGKGHDICAICHDTLPETMQYVKEGIVDFTIAQDPYLQGYMPIKIMYQYIALNILPKEDKLYTNIDVRLKDNIGNKGYKIFTGLYNMRS
jgi:LacI family transcriptional regulator